MTVSRRILLQVATGVFFVVAVATAVTFQQIYGALKERELRLLATYVRERAEREEARFLAVQTNLKLVRGQFLKRLRVPMPAEYVEERFNYWNRRYADGAWRTRESFGDARLNASMWADREWPATPEMRRQAVIVQELCDELLPGWFEAFPSYYFQFPAPGLLNAGVDVLLADWSWKMPAHFDTTGLEWIALALPSGVPKDGFSWTGLQQDDVVSEPLVCTYLPVIVDGQLLASVGHNMPMSHMIDAAAASAIPGASHYIFRTDGRLIAHPAKRAEILRSKGLLTATNCGDETLASLFRKVSARPERRFSGFDPKSGSYYSVARLAGPEWYYLTAMTQAHLRGQAFASASWVLWSGLVSLTLVVAAIALILRRQIARPLAELARATDAMSRGVSPILTTGGRADELGRLELSFREMFAKVVAREQELRRLNADLEDRVAERSRELARFAAIAEATSDFVWFSDLAGRVIYINRSGRRMIGRESDESLAELMIMDFVAPDSREFVESLLIPRALREGSSTGEMALLRRDGAQVQVSTVGMILRDSIGQPSYIAGIMRDISERQKMLRDTERALAREREVSELRANFVSLVSHEFRTPLEVILTSSDILDRYLDRLSPEKRTGYLRMIHDSVKRMGGMMEDVLLLGRVEAGRLGFKPGTVHLANLIGSVVDEMLSATAGSCPIKTEISDSLDGTCADESLLRHLLVNLLSNAIKYSPPGSPVVVRVTRVDRDIVIAIIDHGRGIPVADRTRLFQSFQRGSNVRDTPGTGLGLLIVKKCVEIHQGRLEFDSQEGCGTTFTVTLPLFRKGRSEPRTFNPNSTDS